MVNISKMVDIAGTLRNCVPDSKVIGTPDANDRLKLSIYIRRNPKANPPAVEEIGSQRPSDRKYLTHQQATEAFGADPADLAKVEAFARDRGLAVIESCPARRLVSVSGTVAQIDGAFGVELKQFATNTEHYRGRVGSVKIPEELAGIVEAVLGLDNRRVGQSYLRKAVKLHLAPALAASASLPRNTYFPPQIADLYNFPSGTDGAGQTIGILVFNESGGGYNLSALKKYFSSILSPSVPLPAIQDVVVHGQGNDPHPPSNDPNDPDTSGEVMLDIQVAASVAPGSKIVMYFTEFTQQGWVDVISRVVTDAANDVSVLSISYGNPEKDPRGAWTDAAIRVVDQAFQRAATVGITICVASGDDGSRDQSTDGRAHADFPASSPFVLACGGTRLESSGGAITREVVWHDSIGAGGGISALFPKPTWQNNVNVPPSINSSHQTGRGVPDVAGVADPITGYQIIASDGSFDPRNPTGGTSASTPLWAALIARINQGLNARLGFVNPILYAKCATGVLRDTTQGNIGDYMAAVGWDACTGLGTPNGKAIMNALR